MRYLILLLFISQGLFSQNCDINLKDAIDYEGQEITVCGIVSQVATPKGIKGNPTYLNLGGKYPNHSFTVIIWGSNANKFVTHTDIFINGLKGYEGKNIAITGVIEIYKGKAQINAKEPEQIVILE